jgi:hypothetical protein
MPRHAPGFNHGGSSMKTLLAAACALSLLAPAAVRAQDAGSVPTFHATLQDKMNLKIIRIDKDARLVTLQHGATDTLQVVCGPEIKNFDQLAVGDNVSTNYKEELSIRVDPTGSFSETSEHAMSSAKKGASPAASFWEKHEVSAKITAIDKANGTATIQTMKGEKFTVYPDHPENLDKVQVGNFVVVTQTTTRAISVSKPGKSKGTAKKTTTKGSTKTTTTTKTETK